MTERDLTHILPTLEPPPLTRAAGGPVASTGPAALAHAISSSANSPRLAQSAGAGSGWAGGLSASSVQCRTGTVLRVVARNEHWDARGVARKLLHILQTRLLSEPRSTHHPAFALPGPRWRRRTRPSPRARCACPTSVIPRLDLPFRRAAACFSHRALRARGCTFSLSLDGSCSWILLTSFDLSSARRLMVSAAEKLCTQRPHPNLKECD